MSIRELALTVLAEKDMEDFMKREIIDKLSKTIGGDFSNPKAMFIAIANFPGRFHFHQMIDAWVHENYGIHRIVGDRYEVNKLRGKRYDLLWIDFRLGPRMSWADIQYFINIVSPVTNRLIVTYDTFILHDRASDKYAMYASLVFDDFIALIREDSYTIKIEGVADPRRIKRSQPLQISYLLKRLIQRLFRKDNKK